MANQPRAVGYTQLKLLLSPLFLAAILAMPAWALLPAALLMLPLLWRAPTGLLQLWRLTKLMAVQFVIVWLFYLLRFGLDSWPAALELSARLYLSLWPGLWFFLTTPQHRIMAALSPWLKPRTVLVVATTLALMPRLVREAHQLYQLQCLRGARIKPKQLWRPSAWLDLINTVLCPLLIQLIQLTKQQEMALRARGYRDGIAPTLFTTEDN
ncbi:energy-coupling factor transporter transmembrane component T [Ferrimonas senticii]|uniref:energy-coupling factor transporter transmembrane component T n=1 Tax=Ferrimonas senticii TaxID=394566 RepID=UPI00041F3462|nr:energy-coupling factor transporter transmembrane component T [Ferrimonas senticii]